MFRAKLFQLPKGAKFVFNGVEFERGEILYEDAMYKCTSKKLVVYLHRNTQVELLQDIVPENS